jgi:hypothetical protein
VHSMLAVAISAGVAVVGWFVAHYLSRRAAREQYRREAALKHVERQLGDLYGPLVFLVLEGARVFEDLREDFGDGWYHGDRRLEPAEEEKWLYWTENYFIPRNRRIQDLLSSHSHLIESDHIPDSFLDFIDHHASWTLEIERMRETGVDEGLYSRRTWPDSFSAEVETTFRVLKQRHERLIGAETPRVLEDGHGEDTGHGGNARRRPLRGREAS